MNKESFTACCLMEPSCTPVKSARQRGGSVDEWRHFIISCASEAAAGENWLKVLRARLG